MIAFLLSVVGANSALENANHAIPAMALELAGASRAHSLSTQIFPPSFMMIGNKYNVPQVGMVRTAQQRRQSIGADPSHPSRKLSGSGCSLGTNPNSGDHILTSGTICTLSKRIEIIGNKRLKVSSSSAAQAVISGNDQTQLFYVENSELNLENLILERGSRAGNGGCMYVGTKDQGSSQIVISKNVTFRKCEATGVGGAAAILGSSSLHVVGPGAILIFSGNKGMRGGGLYLQGGKIQTESGSRIIFNDNFAQDYGGSIMLHGGAVLHAYGNETFIGINHSVAQFGAAISLIESSVRLHLGAVLRAEKNTASAYGGGVYLQLSEFTVADPHSQIILTDNHAQIGGAVYALSGASISVEAGSHLVARNNKASKFGAGFNLQDSGASLIISGDGTEVLLDANQAQVGGGICAVLAASISVEAGSHLMAKNKE